MPKTSNCRCSTKLRDQCFAQGASPNVHDSLQADTIL
jgi:hypothetical protein